LIMKVEISKIIKIMNKMKNNHMSGKKGNY